MLNLYEHVFFYVYLCLNTMTSMIKTNVFFDVTDFQATGLEQGDVSTVQGIHAKRHVEWNLLGQKSRADEDRGQWDGHQRYRPVLFVLGWVHWCWSCIFYFILCWFFLDCFWIVFGSVALESGVICGSSLFFVFGFWFFWKNCANVPSRSRRWRMKSMRWKTTTVSCGPK